MDSQAATSEAAERGPCVLLEQCVTLSGRKLEIRVTAKNETNPDTVVVHVEYGTGHAKVTVKDNGQEVTQTRRRKRTLSEGSGSATGRTGAGERGPEEDFPLAGEETGAPRPNPGIAQTCVSSGKAAGASSLTDEGHRDTALSSSKGGDGTGTSTEVSAKPEESMSPGDTNVPLAQRKELHIRRDDPPADLDNKKLEEMLQSMPALRSLKVDWRDDGKKLDIDIVSQHCRNLKEIDLSMFLLDDWSLEQLCNACPNLEVVKLPRNCEDEHVKVLNKLTRLKSLDLERTRITGGFLKTFQRPIEKLSLASCQEWKFQEVENAFKCNASTLPWKSLRELDLRSIKIRRENLIKIFECSPRLERLLVSVPSENMSCLVQLTQCKDLRELDLFLPKPPFGWMKPSASSLADFLSDCPKLQRLALRVPECSFKSTTCFRQLEKCPELRELILHIINVDPTDVAAGLSGCPLLERLSVAGIPSPIEKLVPPTGLLKLTYLNASNSGLTDNSLRRLPQLFPRLSALDLSSCTSVSEDALMSYLPRLKELRALDLTRTLKVPSSVVDKLKRECPLLEITCG